MMEAGVLFQQLLGVDQVYANDHAQRTTELIHLPSQSFFLTLATAASIAFSLGLAYALYTLVLRIKFFPFMNILASVIAVGKKAGSIQCSNEAGFRRFCLKQDHTGSEAEASTRIQELLKIRRCRIEQELLNLIGSFCRKRSSCSIRIFCYTEAPDKKHK